MYFSFLFPFHSGALPTHAHRSTLSPRPSSDIRTPNSLTPALPSRSHTPDPADGGSASVTVLRTTTINFASYRYLISVVLDCPASLVTPQLVAIQPTEVRHSTHIRFHSYSQVPVVLYFLLKRPNSLKSWRCARARGDLRQWHSMADREVEGETLCGKSEDGKSPSDQDWGETS